MEDELETNKSNLFSTIVLMYFHMKKDENIKKNISKIFVATISA